MGAKQQRIETEKSKRHWKAIVRAERPAEASPAFTQYYQQQFRHLLHEDEWATLFAALSHSLPVTVRLNRTTVSSIATDHTLAASSSVTSDGNLTERVPWTTCETIAWQINADRSTLKSSVALQPLHALLCREMSLGNLSRQEAVSMVPALLLDIQQSHWVLDMCASPGSKTRQLLEMFQQSAPEGLPSGVLVGNDSDPHRMEFLRRQFSHSSNPALLLTCERGEAIATHLRSCGPSPFDRILCDAPCSGDGTFRKAPELWRKWSLESGIRLHPLQLQLALHALALLRPGGRMVYSTCSLNPVEDEAVVAEVLRQAKGAAQLVDISDKLPGLKRRAGLSTWHPEPNQAGWLPSMLPPADAVAFHLERCVRILPHDQNTGGFFIAVITKVGDFAMDAGNLVGPQETLCTLRAMDFQAVSHTGHRRRSGLAPLSSHLADEVCQVWGSHLPRAQLWLHRPSAQKSKGKLLTSMEKSTVQLVSPAAAKLLSHCPTLSVLHAGSTVFHLDRSSAGLGNISNTSQHANTPSARCEHVLSPHPDGVAHLLPFIAERFLPVSAATFESVCGSLCGGKPHGKPHGKRKAESDSPPWGHLDLQQVEGIDAQRLRQSQSGGFVVLALTPGECTIFPTHSCAGGFGAEQHTTAGSWQPLTLTLQLLGDHLHCLTSADRVASYANTLATLRHLGWHWPPVPQTGAPQQQRPLPWADEHPSAVGQTTAPRRVRRRL
eukprot:GGOE01017771.1.p1 GENE.GGOE01017771.1~~GGOE01017771.1.p1  ORF type:complete len:722 (-),score=88.85 GGOE01017771.1:338-2503(-)